MNRMATVKRTTKETNLSLKLNLEGGPVDIATGIGFFDHMLTAFAFYADLGIALSAKGDLYVDGHHTVEDTGIVLGQALKMALNDRAGIRRFGSAYVPMDEALCFTALDCSGRPFLVFDAPMHQERIGDYDSCLTVEFMRAVSMNAGLTLHQKAFYGENAHHITEGLFKSFGLALKDAIRQEGLRVPSTKGVL
ncbi:MAG: imidazoleglycerol-phosphate dehydratase HisB [Oscillospiraceae bacterium]|nr:imidazoleglycerol-phosphate dehydratase HisB [Oscillospiraceae bacterium]